MAAAFDLLLGSSKGGGKGNSSDTLAPPLLEREGYEAVLAVVSRCSLATLADPSGLSTARDHLLYGDAVDLFDALLAATVAEEKQREGGGGSGPPRYSGKSFLGYYSDPHLAAWDDVVRSFKKGNLYLAEAARALVQDCKYEVAALRKTQEKNEKRAAEIDRRVSELKHSAREAGKTLVAMCEQSGILPEVSSGSGDGSCDDGTGADAAVIDQAMRLDFRACLLARVPELSGRLRDVHASVQDTDVVQAAEYYRAFTDYVHGDGAGGTARLDALGGLVLRALDDPESTTAVAVKGGDSGGGGDVDWGVEGLDMGDLDLGDLGADDGGGEVKIDWGGDGNDNNTAGGEATADCGAVEIDWAAEFEATTEEGDGEASPLVARALSTTAERHALLTDLLELECFLTQRVVQTTDGGSRGGIGSLQQMLQTTSSSSSSSSSSGSCGSDLLKSTSTEDLKRWLGVVRRVVGALRDDPSLQQLLVISRGGLGLTGMVKEFERLRRKRDKCAKGVDALQTERLRLEEEVRRARPVIEFYRAKVRRHKAVVEAALAGLFDGSRFHLVGDLNTI